MIPEGWSIAEIGQHVDVLTGFAFKSADYTDQLDAIRLLRGDNIAPGRVRWDNAKKWPLQKSDGLGRFALKVGDFVVALDRTWVSDGLKIAEVKQHDVPSYLVQRVARLRAGKNLHQGLLRQLFATDDFERHVKDMQTETLVPHISPNDLRDYEVLLPPLPEQRRIAAVLDAWDDAIASCEKLVTAKMERTTWLADHLAFQADEWLAIDDVAEQVYERAGSNFTSFDVFSCTKHDGLVLSDSYFTKTVYGADRTDYKVVHPLHLAYATNHIEEGSIGLNTHGKPGIVSPMYTVFKAKGIDPHFLISVLKTERLRREFERRTPASVNRRGGLRWGDFAEIEIPCPSAHEQARVLSMLDCARQDLKAADEYLTCLRNQKRGLMQKLLTGQWRVPESIGALLPEPVAT